MQEKRPSMAEVLKHLDAMLGIEQQSSTNVVANYV